MNAVIAIVAAGRRMSIRQRVLRGERGRTKTPLWKAARFLREQVAQLLLAIRAEERNQPGQRIRDVAEDGDAVVVRDAPLIGRVHTAEQHQGIALSHLGDTVEPRRTGGIVGAERREKLIGAFARYEASRISAPISSIHSRGGMSYWFGR